MARKTAPDQFAETFEIEFNPPAKPSELAKLASKFKVTFPDSVVELYARGDGGAAGNELSQLELMPLKAVRQYPAAGFLGSLLGYFPIADNNDSNPICVCCKPPLAGYVVWVNHDDAPRLLHRSLDDFYRAAVKHVKARNDLEHHDLDMNELPTGFDAARRADEDIAAARALMKLAAAKKGNLSGDFVDALRFACDLLSDKHVDEIIGLLQAPDPYVREHAIERLTRIRGPQAKQALANAGGGYDAFIESTAALLKAAGLKVSIQAPYGKKTIRIDAPKVAWLNMDDFYAQRHRPDFKDFLLTRATEASGKKIKGK